MHHYVRADSETDPATCCRRRFVSTAMLNHALDSSNACASAPPFPCPCFESTDGSGMRQRESALRFSHSVKYRCTEMGYHSRRLSRIDEPMGWVCLIEGAERTIGLREWETASVACEVLRIRLRMRGKEEAAAPGTSSWWGADNLDWKRWERRPVGVLVMNEANGPRGQVCERFQWRRHLLSEWRGRFVQRRVKPMNDMAEKKNKKERKIACLTTSVMC